MFGFERIFERVIPMKLILYTDGGARGNPGPAGAGVVLKDSYKKTIKEVGAYLGVCTNNEAEYKALVLGMQAALKKGATELTCYLDSELIVKQLNGEYKVKNPRMKVFYGEVRELEGKIGKVVYRHVKRDKNKEADALVNEVLDARE